MNALRSCLVSSPRFSHQAISISRFPSFSDILVKIPLSISPRFALASITANSVFCHNFSLFLFDQILLIVGCSYLAIIFVPPIYVIDGYKNHRFILHDDHYKSIFFIFLMSKKPYKNIVFYLAERARFTPPGHKLLISPKMRRGRDLPIRFATGHKLLIAPQPLNKKHHTKNVVFLI